MNKKEFKNLSRVMNKEAEVLMTEIHVARLDGDEESVLYYEKELKTHLAEMDRYGIKPDLT
jgi:hypothetical protein